jgi:cell division protein FtsZ
LIKLTEPYLLIPEPEPENIEEEPFLVTEGLESAEPQTELFQDEVIEDDDIVIHNLDDAPLEESPNNTFNLEEDKKEEEANEVNKVQSREAFLERQSQVKRTLNDVKMKLRLPGRILDLENEPAFKRRNVTLDDVAPSSESSVSRFSINEEVDEHGGRKIELRDDNPYLHDNVD